MPEFFIPRIGFVLTGSDFKPGDPAPISYQAWHEWAEVQHKAGLRQVQCGRCSLWKFSQELGDLKDTHETQTGRGAKQGRGKKVTVVSPVCLKCAAKTKGMT